MVVEVVIVLWMQLVLMDAVLMQWFYCSNDAIVVDAVVLMDAVLMRWCLRC